MASGRWQEKSGQWPAKQAEASGDVRKAPNEPNWNRPLIAFSEGVNVDGFGPVYAERTQFRGLSTARDAALRENRDDRKESVSSFYFHLSRFPRAKRSAAPSKRVGSRISAWFKSWVFQVTVRTVPVLRRWRFCNKATSSYGAIAGSHAARARRSRWVEL